MHVSRLTAPGYWTSWRLWHGPALAGPDAMSNLALRTPSTLANDALALAASDGRFTADELQKLLVSGDRPVTGLTGVRTAQLAALALVWCAGGSEAVNLQAGAAAYEALWDDGQAAGLRPEHHQVAAQALFQAGRREALGRLLPQLTAMPAEALVHLTADLAHPYLDDASPDDGAPSPGHGAWEGLLSVPFVRAGHVPLTVTPPGPCRLPHLFDHLRAPCATPASVAGPLVTVVVPCFRPDEGLLTSIASMTAQTYADLEILLVDDASGPQSRPLFEQAIGSDPRARLLTMNVNGGSYLARQAAIAQSRGAYVTFQDADDWSHPERIERQVALLEADLSAPASRSQAVRARDDLTHQWIGSSVIRINASSLMVRREVLDRLGPFLPIRRGADSEYAERIGALAGQIADTGTPLAVTRLRSGSLSRADFQYQWTAPDRLAFRGTYRARHRALRGAAQGVAVADGLPVPLSFLRDLAMPARVSSRLDTAYLADFRADPNGPHQPPSLAWLWARLATATAATRGGLWHVERPVARSRSRPEMHPTWYDLIVAKDDLQAVTRVETVDVDRLVVLEASSLLLAGDQPCAVRPARVELALSPEDVGADGLPIDLLGVGDVVRAWFGVEPQWLPAPHLDPAQVSVVREAVGALLDGTAAWPG